MYQPFVDTATNAIRLTAQIECVEQLLWGLLWVVLAFLFASFRRFLKQEKEVPSDEENLRVVLMTVSLLASALFAIGALVQLCNPYAWVGLWHPDVWILHRLIGYWNG